MRAAAILGLGCSPKILKPFQNDKTQVAKTIEWRMGTPSSRDQVDVVLLFGGDGTIHRHLSQLVKLGLPVLIVPAGSGNDFARALGLRRVRDSLAAWQKFCGDAADLRANEHVNVRAIDLGVITPSEPGASPASAGSARNPVLSTRYFASVAGVGLDGEVARRANQLPRWLRGRGGYILSLAPTIFRFAPLPMKILTPASESGQDPASSNHPENETWTTRSDRPTLLAAFANTPFYGGGMKIAPQAKTDDGLLDVCIVGGVAPFKLFSVFPTVYAGRHLNIREVAYFKAGRAQVETEHPLDVYADGEFVCRTPVEIRVAPAALRIITS